MAKPKTNWTVTSKNKSNWTITSKNKTNYLANASLASTLTTYDDSTLSYDSTVTYYDSYNANTGSLFDDKKDTNWSAT